MTADGAATRRGQNAEVIVVAMLRVKPGTAAEAIEGFTPVIEQTHLEEGCMSYALHQDKGDPDGIILIERWRSQGDLDGHFRQPYMAGMGEVASRLLAEPPEVIFCSPVPVGQTDKGML